MKDNFRKVWIWQVEDWDIVSFLFQKNPVHHVNPVNKSAVI